MNTTLATILAAAVLFASRSAFAQFPESILEWIAGPPPIAGKASYTAFHAENRIDNFNPQLLPKDDQVSDIAPWRPTIANLQPFRSFVDRKNGKIYWRKDFFD